MWLNNTIQEQDTGAVAKLNKRWRHYAATSSAMGGPLHAAFFKAAHELNPELEATYAANRLGPTRQLHFSPRFSPLRGFIAGRRLPATVASGYGTVSR
jgi:hypothetical protein